MAEEETKQLQNKRKKLISQQKQEERKKRDKRLYEKGAVFESNFNESKDFTKDEFYQLITFQNIKEAIKNQKNRGEKSNNGRRKYRKKEKVMEKEQQSLVYKGAFIHPKGCVRSPKALAESISANADTGELHSPTEINFLPLVYFPVVLP